MPVFPSDPLVAVQTYRTVTLDTTSADNAVVAHLEDAIALVEQFTRRELDYAERTETLRVDSTGRVWPLATPIESVSDPEDATVLDASIITGWGGLLFPDRTLVGSGVWPTRATVTYLGGWTADTLPVGLRRLLCQVAYDLLHPASDFAQIPAGVSTARVGDVSVSTGGPAGGGATGSFDPFAAIKPAVQTQLIAWRKPSVLG